MPTSSRSRWLLLLALTVLVRGVVLWAMFGKLADDPDGYAELAENLAREGIFGYGKPGDNILPTAYRPPLYPLVLSTAMDGTYHLSRVRVVLIHLVLGTATVMLTLDLGERLKLGNWSYLAAGLVCFDPILLNQSALVMTETLATFLAVLSLWCLTRLTQFPEWWNALMAGGAMGLAALCRPTFLPWFSLVLIASLFAVNLTWSRRTIHTTVMICGSCLFLLPWGIRNRIESGKLIFTTTHGGYTFGLGNCLGFYRFLREGRSLEEFKTAIDKDDRSVTIQMIDLPFDAYPSPRMANELHFDKFNYERSTETIADQPVMFAYACAYRLYQLFNPLPHPTSDSESLARRLMRYAVAAWYVLLYLFALVGLIRLRKELLSPPWLWGVLLVATFMAVHTFYWTNIRMRAPLMPFLCLVAAAGSMHLAEPLAHARLMRKKALRAC